MAWLKSEFKLHIQLVHHKTSSQLRKWQVAYQFKWLESLIRFIHNDIVILFTAFRLLFLI